MLKSNAIKKIKSHISKNFFSAKQSDSVLKLFLNQTTLDLREKKWGFLNRDFPVIARLEILPRLYSEV